MAPSKHEYDSLTPEQQRPPPWIDETAKRIYAEVSNQTISEMLAGEEDPGDTPLYLLRRQQVEISLKCFMEIDEEKRRR